MESRRNPPGNPFRSPCSLKSLADASPYSVALGEADHRHRLRIVALRRLLHRHGKGVFLGNQLLRGVGRDHHRTRRRAPPTDLPRPQQSHPGVLRKRVQRGRLSSDQTGSRADREGRRDRSRLLPGRRWRHAQHDYTCVLDARRFADGTVPPRNHDLIDERLSLHLDHCSKTESVHLLDLRAAPLQRPRPSSSAILSVVIVCSLPNPSMRVSRE